MNKIEFFEKNGFSAEGITYMIIGEGTYAIKEWLKEQGCKFSPVLKWHSAKTFKLPEGFQWIVFKFEDIMEWVEEEENGYYLESAVSKVQVAINSTLPPSKSEYLGAVGERLRNLTVILKSIRSFNGRFGLTYVYAFQRGEDVLTWFTQKDLELEEGLTVDLTGTIKAHTEYKNEKQTQLSRCIVKVVG